MAPLLLDSANVAACFREFSDGKGFLNKREVKFALTALFGVRPSKFELAEMMERIGSVDPAGGAGKVVYPDAFAAVVQEKAKRVDVLDLTRQLFCAFDVGGRGFLRFQDVLACFRQVWPSVSPQTVLDVFTIADRDGDGRIGYGEFQAIMNGSPSPWYSRP